MRAPARSAARGPHAGLLALSAGASAGERRPPSPGRWLASGSRSRSRSNRAKSSGSRAPKPRPLRPSTRSSRSSHRSCRRRSCKTPTCRHRGWSRARWRSPTRKRSEPRTEPAASVETSGQAAPEPPLGGAAGTTADVGQPRREPVQAAAARHPIRPMRPGCASPSWRSAVCSRWARRSGCSYAIGSREAARGARRAHAGHNHGGHARSAGFSLPSRLTPWRARRRSRPPS